MSCAVGRRGWRLLPLLAFLAGGASPQPTSTVGMPTTIKQLVIPGPEVEVKPIEDLKTPVVIRIDEVYAHGSAHRYDLTYYALKPGAYDLLQYLRRKDGSVLKDVPPVEVVVEASLPSGQVEPHKLASSGGPFLGGYRSLLLSCGLLWSAGLVLILYLTRRKPGAAQPVAARPMTLADHLKPLVESALAGTLSPGQHAELERLLLGYWRKRLELEYAEPATAMATMRSHPEAGPVVRQLEEWLHKPGGSAAVSVAEMLEPYRDISAEPLEQEPAAAGRPS